MTAGGTGAPPERPAGGWRLMAVTIGGSGLSPVAPGTVGSLATVLVLAGVLAIFYAAAGRSPTPVEWNGVLIAGLLFFSALCVALGPWTFAYFGRKDPGSCVLDEGAGICLTAMFLPMYSGWRQAWVLLAVFAAFRVFDVLKPPPAKQLEKLPQGWGILTDDLMAAVYANVACQVMLRWLG